MTGMDRGISTGNAIVHAAFLSALRGGVLHLLLLALVLALAWVAIELVVTRHGTAARAVPLTAEPRARLVLRLAFGALWTLDGLLQLQPAMPIGLPSQVLQPAAAGAPGWVQSIVDVGVRLWTEHPVTAAASAVWIQIALGIALLVAPRGWWSRSAGVATAAWGLVVWCFGEALGGLFTPGQSWLFGQPGAALLYAAAGVLLALPESAWTERLGRRVVRAVGVEFVAAAVLQAWPGRGSWQGLEPHGGLGLTASMASQMAQTPQPGPIQTAVDWFGRLSTAHGFAVNVVAVVALAAIGLALVAGSRRVALAGAIAAIPLCLATWLLVQDLGVFGGVGTDPNSMLPTLAILLVGVVGWRAAPQPARAPDEALSRASGAARLWQRVAEAGVVLTASTLAVGVVPMALASIDSRPDAILTEALNGTPLHTDFPEFPVSLVDQHGQRVTLASLRGHVVVLTFLDPVCTTDCPLIGQQLAAADRAVKGTSPAVDFVAIDANPEFRTTADLRAYDAAQHLTGLANWYYLTGTIGELGIVWQDYAADVESLPAGSMVAHDDLVDVISPMGDVRSTFRADPGNSSITHASLATLVIEEVERVQSL